MQQIKFDASGTRNASIPTRIMAASAYCQTSPQLIVAASPY